ncbi:hypothetical protein EJB05_27260 [Eragrostis curvula]|uniref:Uncharacterized protein n=1 Tax=Eragrostis curvula TaxID=38414 RepID=A0A5J9UNG8_9POAL|nr:hypothetical protein EJB05_27260 [Eragrostis curvula]
MLERLVRVADEDNERFLLKLKERVDRVQNLDAEAEEPVGSSGLAPYCPEDVNSIINTEAANALHILPSSGQCPSSTTSAASSSPADMLTELSRREKAANIKPDADINAFMKAMLFCLTLVTLRKEKLEPLENMNDDPVICFLNWLYAKKRKELQEHQRLKDVQLPEEQKDVRHLDEILCFINRNGGMSMASYTRILKSLADWKQRRRDWSKQGSIVETREDDGSRSLTTDETKCQKMMLKISLRELAHKSTMEDAISEV